MRPFNSSSLPIEGMLVFTFTARRADQNPSWIFTARTGTLRSFAYGECARFKTPWSRQLVSEESGISLAGSLQNEAKLCGIPESAAAEAAAETNSRRETREVMDGAPGLTGQWDVTLSRAFSGVKALCTRSVCRSVLQICLVFVSAGANAFAQKAGAPSAAELNAITERG